MGNLLATVGFDLIVQRGLLDERQNHRSPTPPASIAGTHVQHLRGKDFERVVVVVRGQPKLLEVVAALHTTRGLASGLHGREQQGDQDANDGDHDQEFHQRKAKSRRSSASNN
jgi:hypothetical protein